MASCETDSSCVVMCVASNLTDAYLLSDRVLVFMCTAKLKCAKKYASSMADLAVA